MQRTLFLVVVISLILAGCAPTPVPGAATAAATGTAAALTKITLPVGYIADVQFAPLYVAVDKGFYREQGLEVDFDYRFETDAVKLVSTNQIPFAIASGEQIVLARGQDLPVVYTLQWYRRFPVAVLSKASAGIQTPQDLKGKRVGLPVFGGASFVGWRALLWKAGLTPQDVVEQDLGGFVQVQALQEDRVDAVVVYAANEPVQFRLQGEDVNVLYVADYADLVGNGLMTNETQIRTNPALVRAMTTATLAGIRYTLDHPDEAVQIAQKFVPDMAKDEASLALARAVLAESIKLWQPGAGVTLGVSDAAAWATTQEALLQMGDLKQSTDVARMFTNDFVR